MLTDAEIRDCLAQAQLAELADRVLAQTTVEVRITATPADSFALGQSRIGGEPDLPGGMEWPRHRWTRAETETWPEWDRDALARAIEEGVVSDEGERVALALPFVAQLNLAELTPHQSVLPRTGHLWLFADQGTTLGSIGDYPYCATACAYAELAELVPRASPPVPEHLPGYSLVFAAERSLPSANELGIDGAAWYRYAEAIKALEQPAPRHACLVRPESGSIAFVPPEGHVGLLRVDSDDRLCWGDAAWITFAIPREALSDRQFEAVRAFRWIG